MDQLNLKKLLILLLLFASVNGFSQAGKTLKWHINYDEVIIQAKIQNKPVLLFFHGSDWCPPCIRMQKEVFDSPEFIEYSIEKILFLDVDFPYKNKLSEERLKHNNDLKQKYGLPEEFSQGYPQVVIVDKNDKVLYQEKGYNGEGPDKLIEIVKHMISEQ